MGFYISVTCFLLCFLGIEQPVQKLPHCSNHPSQRGLQVQKLPHGINHSHYVCLHGFPVSNRELYGTYTAYSTRNSFLDSKTPATVAMGQSPHWNLDSKTTALHCQCNLTVRNAIGVVFSNVDSPPPFPPRVHIGWGRYAGKRKVIELFACHCRTKHALMFF